MPVRLLKRITSFLFFHRPPQAGAYDADGDAKRLIRDIKAAHLVIATAQFLAQKGRLAALAEETAKNGPLFSGIVCDEAHHLPAPTWKKILATLRGDLARFPNTRYIAMTGTPFRTRGAGIPHVRPARRAAPRRLCRRRARPHLTAVRPAQEDAVNSFTLLHALREQAANPAEPKCVKDICFVEVQAEEVRAGSFPILSRIASPACRNLLHPSPHRRRPTRPSTRRASPRALRWACSRRSRTC